MAEPSLFKEIPTGAVITEVSPMPSNPNMRRIKVGGKIVARLPASDVEEIGIEAGRKWSAALAKRVAEAMEHADARKHAMTMLGKRALSRGELVDRLIRRGHSEAMATRVSHELAADHWLDDEAYATALAEEIVRNKSASHTMIVDRLVRRKIDESLARAVAQRTLGNADPLEAATELAQKRLATMKGVSTDRAARRIAGTLARRGYDEETIEAALQRIGLV